MGGVQAFLVISAYFLTSKYLKYEQHSVSVGDAFKHRIKRLYPVYLTLVLLFSTFLIVYTKRINAEPLWYILSLQNFRVLFNGATYQLDNFIGHFWYICLDVWLFLLWVTVLRIVTRKHLRKVFVISIILGLTWRTLAIFWGKYSASYMIPLGQLDSWALGGLLALNIRDKGHNKSLMCAEIILGLVGISFMTYYNAHLSECNVSEAFQLWSNSGGLSYELYCFHYPIKFFADKFIQNDVLMLLLALFFTCLVSFLWNKWMTPLLKRIINS